MRHGSLFSGIGGFDLAAQWMGWENVFHCEWNEFGQKVLKHHFPKSISYNDITKTDFTIHRGQIDILTGGFPCQPYSQAGKRKGKEDERHLWPQMLRAVREIKPTYVVGENVYGLINWNDGLVFDEVQSDLEAEGYEVIPVILPACAVNAPHRRDRIWFVAYSKSARAREDFGGLRSKFNGRSQRVQKNRDATNSERSSSEGKHIEGQGQSEPRGCDWGDVPKWKDFPTQPPICGGDDGLPAKLDGITFSKWRNESIKAYGNSVVPQVVYQIFKAIG